MSTWLHCNLDEPHGFHEWYTEPGEFGSSCFACPGIKDGPLIQRRVLAVRSAEAALAHAQELLRRKAVECRRTPHQFYMNDDNAPEEDPDHE